MSMRLPTAIGFHPREPRPATGRQRMWVGGSLAVAVLAVGLAIFAEVNRREAQTQRDRAKHDTRTGYYDREQSRLRSRSEILEVERVPAAAIRTCSSGRCNCRTSSSGSGETSQDLRRIKAAASIETVTALRALGDSKGAVVASTTREHPLGAAREIARITDYQAHGDCLRPHRRCLGCSRPLAGGAASIPGSPRRRDPSDQIKPRQCVMAGRARQRDRQGRQRARCAR